MAVLSLDALTPLVRLHVYEAMTVHGYDAVDADYIAECIDPDVTSSYVKMAFRQLNSAKDLEYEVKRNPIGGDVHTGNVFITAKGVKAVEKDLQNEESYVYKYQLAGLDGAALPFVKSVFAPASDRLVSFSDNEAAAQKAVDAVGKLQTTIIETNDLPEDLRPFKDVILGEVEVLKSLVNKSIVRASIVLTIARRLLPWISEKAGGAAIGELAKRALAALIDWLS